MINFDQVFAHVHYEYPFCMMLGDIHDFLEFSERNIEWQLLVVQQSIQRRTLESFGFDDNNLAQSEKNQLLETAEYRFTVALPMQIRYAALGALTNTTEWAARFFQSDWKPQLPTRPKNLRDSQVPATLLLAHFATTLSLAKPAILADYSHLVEVRNVVVHNSGVVRNLVKFKLQVLRTAIDALKGFSITDCHLVGKRVKIERGALDPYIEGMLQLLTDINTAANERGLLGS
jgi:hypothetical protein